MKKRHSYHSAALVKLREWYHRRGKDKRKRVKKAAISTALYQVPEYFPGIDLITNKPPSVQLVPRRKHASSGFQYPA